MELQDVQLLLERFTEPNGRLTALFVTKTGTKYSAFQPQISTNLQTEIIRLFKETINSKRDDENLSKVPFNPSGQEQDEYSECSTDYVGNYGEVINLFDSANSEIEPDDISFIIFRLRVNDDTESPRYIYFFRKNHKLKTIRKGFWMRKVDHTFRKLEGNKLVAIDGAIDAVSLDDSILFFSHISAERIFNLREKFRENASLVLNDDRVVERIDNFEEFQDDCLNDARIIRRLTKIQSNPAIIDLFHEHFGNAPEVVELFDLNITFNDEESSIIYENKEQLTHITMLMRDAYYRTILADRKGIDDFNV
ncbi:Kiwa anti-phage protein KwaB-like domain-containing protein [Salimicrobium salexigens]|uniref:DUF4868 domain-containing protein n=1 Tax=Salimicrobium salexigens TaxID=908941 RepID=A0ABY1KR69_9BACI|nr:Kiwa anti-phage protein KwaB-like domain-containing protein [Salimicrobium salexigens]SIS66562.1 protein of unknown function [Salimicrobium salexigens]